MRRILAAIMAGILATLACSQSPDVGTPVSQPSTPTAIPTPSALPTPRVLATDQPASGILATPTEPPVSLTITALQSLNVRQYPNTRARVVGVLYTGDTVTTTGQGCTDTGWIEINYQWISGDTGWVHSTYVEPPVCDQRDTGE